MASIHKRQGARGTSYVVRYRVNGRNAAKTLHSHREALAFKAEVETQVHRGRAVDPKYSRQTYSEWHAYWMTTRLDLRPNTRNRVQSIANNYLIPTFGNTPMENITQQAVQTFILTLPLAPATIHRTYGELNASLKAAVNAGVIHDSPCRGIKLPKISKKQETILDHDEIEALASHILPRYRALIYTLAYAGLRQGEAFDLKPTNVDLVNRKIYVTSTVTKDEKGRKISGTPKSSAGTRTVPIPRFVADELQTHMQTYPGEYVFTGGRGSQLHGRNFSQRTFANALTKWNAAREADNLPPITMTPHDLRHTAITHWISKGADVARVKAWAGHSTASFTLDRYASYFPTKDDEFMDSLDRDIRA